MRNFHFKSDAILPHIIECLRHFAKSAALIGILAHFFGAGVAASYAATYYVDFAAGNDNSNGTSASTPFKHAPGGAGCTGTCAATNPVSGDKVIFKKGVVYYGGLISVNSSGSAVASGNVGNINSAGVLTNAASSFISSGVKPAADYVYIYHSKVSQTGTWVESTGLFKVASVDSATQLALQNFTGKAYSGGDMTFTVVRPVLYTADNSWGVGNATISGDLNNNGSCTDAGDITTVVNLNQKSYLRFENLSFGCTKANSGSALGALNCSGGGCNYLEFVNCVFSDIGESGVSTWPSNYNVFSGNTVQRFNYIALDGGGLSSLHENNTILGDNINSIRSSCFGSRFSISRYNYIKDVSGNYVGDHADSIGFIDESISHDADYGWIYGNTIDNYVQGIYFANNGFGGTKYWVIHSNVIIGRYGDTGKGDKALWEEGTHYHLIANNTFYGIPGSGALRHLRYATGSSYATQYNNLFYATGGEDILQMESDSATGNAIDYNHYYSPGGSTPFNYAGTGRTLTYWRNTLGYDTHGVGNLTTDPQFVSTGSTPNLQLSSGSTADIGTGINLSGYFTLDKNGSPRPASGAWDLGAYSYGTNTAPAQPRNLKIIP